MKMPELRFEFEHGYGARLAEQIEESARKAAYKAAGFVIDGDAPDHIGRQTTVCAWNGTNDYDVIADVFAIDLANQRILRWARSESGHRLTTENYREHLVDLSKYEVRDDILAEWQSFTIEGIDIRGIRQP